VASFCEAFAVAERSMLGPGEEEEVVRVVVGGVAVDVVDLVPLGDRA